MLLRRSCILFFLLSGVLQAQSLDSLLSVWEGEDRSDSLRVHAYKEYVWNGLLFAYPDSAFNCAEKLIEYSEEKTYPKARALGYNIQGASYILRGDRVKALDYFERSLLIFDDLEDDRGSAAALNNIGLIYEEQGEYEKALAQFERSLAIEKSLNDQKAMASALNNIGLIHSNMENYELALQHHQLSLELREETEDKLGIAASLNNIGTVHQALEQYSEAMKCYEQSLAIKRAIGDERSLPATIDNLGELHILLGEPEAAIRYCKEGLALAERLEVLTYQRSNCKCLYDAYKDLGKSGLALRYLERTQILGDSLHSEETSRKLQQLEFKLEEIEQKKLAEEQERLLKAETARRNSMQYSGILIAIIAFFGLLLMSGRLKLPRKVVEAGIFFTLLIVFEFLLVLTDPSVAAFAQGQPAYHLLINAALALLILPLHALFARLLRKRLRRQDVSS